MSLFHRWHLLLRFSFFVALIGFLQNASALPSLTREPSFLLFHSNNTNSICYFKYKSFKSYSSFLNPWWGLGGDGHEGAQLFPFYRLKTELPKAWREMLNSTQLTHEAERITQSGILAPVKSSDSTVICSFLLKINFQTTIVWTIFTQKGGGQK